MVDKKERYIGLDIMKSIAIYIIILYHIGAFAGNVVGNVSNIEILNYYFKTFLTVGVPIFFFVNGALLFNKEFDLKKHCKKLINIVLLTLFWSLATYIIIKLIINEKLSLMETIKSTFFVQLNYNNTLWFLFTLVGLHILFPMLKLAYDNNKKIFYFFLGITFFLAIGNNFLMQCYNIVAYILGKSYMDINMNYFVGFNPVSGTFGYAVVYFMLGGLIFHLKDKFTTKKLKIFALITIIISTLATFGYGMMVSQRLGKTYEYVGIDMYNNIFTLLSVISLFVLCMSYKNNKITDWIFKSIGNNTLGIYLTHMIIIDLFMKYGFYPYKNLIGGMIILVISLSICMIVKKIPILRKLLLS